VIGVRIVTCKICGQQYIYGMPHGCEPP